LCGIRAIILDYSIAIEEIPVGSKLGKDKINRIGLADESSKLRYGGVARHRYAVPRKLRHTRWVNTATSNGAVKNIVYPAYVDRIFVESKLNTIRTMMYLDEMAVIGESTTV
jgi:hypothetical protein